MYSSSTLSAMESNAAWLMFSFLAAIVGGILVYVLFVNKNKNVKLEGWQKKLYEFLSFDSLILEVLLKVIYIILMIYITLSSFALISRSFLGFLSLLIFGNVILRLVLELLLMQISLWRNVREIRKNLDSKNK